MKGERWTTTVNFRQTFRCRAVKPDGKQCCAGHRGFSCGIALCRVHLKMLKEKLRNLEFVEL